MQAKAVVIDLFGRRLDDYSQWRNRLMQKILAYQAWYDKQEHDDAEYELRLHELVDSLRTDKLTLAVVGEFSRGKTELINGLFFSDYNRRLLPSMPGRTTMCPTEILYDERIEPSIRLLPIETRKSALTISEHKKHPINWTKLVLNLNSADEMAEILQETMRSKPVPVHQARELGLYTDEIINECNAQKDQIEVPVWRHAIINFPHPLLKQGLVILDTPGLNALGSEPELTLNMLPAAHAILFVLAADTGVTKTDLEVWKHHVCIATRSARARLVTLNKVDTFWDELLSESEVTKLIDRQLKETARLLDVDRDHIFPVSAQKGLVGKIKKNGMLVERSGLPRLEAKLSVDIVALKQKFVRDKVVNDAGNVVQSSYNEIALLVENKSRELAEINALQGKSSEAIDALIEKLKQQKLAHEKQVQNFNVTRKILLDQLKHMLARMSIKRFDASLLETRDSMRDSWTTNGLRNSMSRFFTETGYTLDLVEKEADAIRDTVEKIYQHFHTGCGLPKTRPVKFSVSPFVRQFARLHREADMFRDSAAMVMMEQHYVIKKFFLSMAISARTIFQDCRTSARNWGKAVLRPIKRLIDEHQNTIVRRMENLEKLQHNHSSLTDRIKETKEQLADLKKSAADLDELLEILYGDAEADEPEDRVTEPACG